MAPFPAIKDSVAMLAPRREEKVKHHHTTTPTKEYPEFA
jgi:hypothetical protein